MLIENRQPSNSDCRITPNAATVPSSSDPSKKKTSSLPKIAVGAGIGAAGIGAAGIGAGIGALAGSIAIGSGIGAIIGLVVAVIIIFINAGNNPDKTETPTPPAAAAEPPAGAASAASAKLHQFRHVRLCSNELQKKRDTEKLEQYITNMQGEVLHSRPYSGPPYIETHHFIKEY